MNLMRDSAFNRRSLLKALVAIPAISAMEGCDRSCSEGSPSTINVVLHGAYVLELNRETRRAFVHIPTVKGDNTCYDHVYLIGQWGLEQELRPTTGGPPLHIKNLIGSDTVPEMQGIDENDAVIRKPLTRAADARTILELPLPKDVRPARSAYLKDPEGGATLPFFEQTDLLSQPKQLPTTLVLVYQSHRRSCHLDIDGNCCPPYINLHVFAEPATDPDPAHTLAAFKGIQSLFKELSQLKYNQEWCPESGCNPDYEQGVRAATPAGLNDFEILSLAQRNELEETFMDHAACNKTRVPSGGHHVGTCLHLLNVT